MTQTDHILELISAYVDGEVTPDEQVRAEQLIRETERCRRWHDELLSVRANLQAIPVIKLDDQFSDRVLAALDDIAPESDATDSALSAAKATNGTLATERDVELPATSTPRNWRKTATSIAVAAVAVAAAIMLLLHFSQTNDHPSHSVVESPDKVDPEPSIATLANNPEIITTDTVPVTTPPPQIDRQMCLLMELVLTPEAAEEGVFEQTVVANGIEFGAMLPLDDTMRGKMLQHRLLQGRPADLSDAQDDDKDAKEQLELTLVECTFGEADRLMSTFMKRDVAGLLHSRFDVALLKDDFVLFEAFRMAAREPVNPKSSDPSPVTKYARKLAIDQVLQSQLIKNLGTLSMIGITAGGDVPKPPTAPQFALDSDESMRDTHCTVLFLVRWQPSK